IGCPDGSGLSLLVGLSIGPLPFPFQLRLGRQHLVQYSVHKFGGFLVAEIFGELDGLVHRDLGRHLVQPQQFIGAEPENVAINDLHPAHFPIGRVFTYQHIEIFLMFQYAADQPLRERFDFVSRMALLPELVQPDARFAVNVVLKQDLQRALTRLMARSHDQIMRLRAGRFVAPFLAAVSFFGPVPSLPRIMRITVAISIADLAASPPRLNLVGSARTMACATVSVVRTPNMMGTSASKAACPIPRLASALM